MNSWAAAWLEEAATRDCWRKCRGRVLLAKNKLPDMFAKKGEFEKADVTTLNTEHVPTINTVVKIITRNVKNTFKNEPWSALECPQGPTNPSHDPLDQVKTSVMELDKDMVEERQYKEHG
jgi:hypothetical protein